jgi:UDP-N-acetylmuramoylalanine--D-glutamate ligase
MLVTKKAPDFTATTVLADGQIVDNFNLYENIGENGAVLFFYPLDFTFVCPSEIIAFSHRVEEFKDNKNRVWINDSKATNPDATIAALTPYKTQKIYLILGGDDKDADQTKLFETIKEYDLEVFTIGANESKLTSLAKDYDIPCTNCQNLNIAVLEISKKHDINSIALLSPSAASLDQYSSYAQRGEEFINFVKDLR